MTSGKIDKRILHSQLRGLVINAATAGWMAGFAFNSALNGYWGWSAFFLAFTTFSVLMLIAGFKGVATDILHRGNHG